MSYRVEYTQKAKRDLKKLSLEVAQNIILSVNSIKAEPYSYVKKIKGTKKHPLYTHRVGEYRVILGIEDDRLLILVIEAGIGVRFTGSIDVVAGVRTVWD